MKRISWIFLFIALSIAASGQRNADYGIFGGISSYLGDINPSKLLYSPLPAGGVFYRYNFHPRHALRANIFMGGLRGDDLDFHNDFQQARAASFSGAAGEFAIQFEFNFLPYTTAGKLWDWSPYFAAGAGVAFVYSDAMSFQPVIPFSGGIKVNIYKNMGFELEYGFRKSFYDNFDGLKDMVDPADYAWLHNNDWYSFLGIGFTWKIYNKLAGCPAYDDEDGKRRR
jgi:hypothetical protein